MKLKYWVLIAILVIAIAAYFIFLNSRAHDYQSCLKAGGVAGQNNENFFCKINERWYWNIPSKGFTN